MKKLFIVGALLASMAFSSVASAAVTYGEGNLALNYAPATNSLTIAEGSLAILGGQKSVVVENAQGDLYYVDQTTESATNFGTMNLKGEELPEGTYTVRASSENSTSILSNTFNYAIKDIELVVTKVDKFENGYVWAAAITKGDADITGFSASFTATVNGETDGITKSVTNVDAMTGFDGDGVLSFNVGLKTDKELTSASFTATDANGSATDDADNI